MTAGRRNMLCDPAGQVLKTPVSEVVDAVLVPQRAVQEQQGAKIVFVVDKENKVQLRTISVGDKSDSYLIVLDGLKAGERVIVEGMQKARPGGQVKLSSRFSRS